MIHVYKSGGIRKASCGKEYTIKSINAEDKEECLSDGWVMSLGEVKKPKAKAKKVVKDDNQE